MIEEKLKKQHAKIIDRDYNKKNILIETKEGYLIPLNKEVLKKEVETDIYFHTFSKRNPFSLRNIKEVWLPSNAPDYELIEFKNINEDRINLLGVWRNINTGETFERRWFSFRKKPYKTIDKNRLQESRIANQDEEINNLLKKQGLDDWKLVEGEKYKSNTDLLLFTNSKGYLAKKSFANLEKYPSLPLFTTYHQDTALHNIRLYLANNTKDITLVEGQRFNGMNKGKLKLNCKLHGEFEVYWCNFYYREQGCPQCMSIQKSKGEATIQKYLVKHNINFKSQYKFKDLKGDSGKCLRFDFAILNSKGDIEYLIEYQGEQHFKEIPLFGGAEGLKKRQKNDNSKRNYCLKNNIKLVEIEYERSTKKLVKELKKIFEEN